MEVFRRAKIVRLKSCHGKYLTADEDEESVVQDRRGSSKSAKWTVEFVEGGDTTNGNVIRLKSCYGKYLTASKQAFLLGMTGRKVVQSAPKRPDEAVEWEPVKAAKSAAVKLKARLHGRFLRANGGLPPWRNSVTHDIPHRTATQEWIVWEVEIMDILPVPETVESSLDEVATPPEKNKSDSIETEGLDLEPIDDDLWSRQAPRGDEGRLIYYHIVAYENGELEEGYEEEEEEEEELCITFKGNGVNELTRRLEEELGLIHGGITVCSRSPLNHKQLYPLHLQLPPNNAAMHLVVLPTSPLLDGSIIEDGIHQKALHETAKAVPSH